MDANKLDELADRVERLTGPDREVDAAIMRLFTNSVESYDGDFWYGPHGTIGEPVPAYTASIDAALTLVPEGWAWMAGCAAGEGFFASLAIMDEECRAPEVDVTASTSALALTAACLRAIAKGN
jgi:hypothetical protein